MGIYDRVADTAPALFPDLPETGPGGRVREKRGQEKRRHLLRYLRGHPEELRPVEEPAPNSGGAREDTGEHVTEGRDESRPYGWG